MGYKKKKIDINQFTPILKNKKEEREMEKKINVNIKRCERERIKQQKKLEKSKKEKNNQTTRNKKNTNENNNGQQEFRNRYLKKQMKKFEK